MLDKTQGVFLEYHMARVKQVKRKDPNARHVHSVVVDDEIWYQAGKILEQIGLTRSEFAELIFKSLAMSDNLPMKEVYNQLFSDVAQHAFYLKNKEALLKEAEKDMKKLNDI